MKSSRRFLACALALCNGLAAPLYAAADKSTPDEAKIARVENGLFPAVILKDRPASKLSIAERMRHYHVPGAGVAVLDKYAIAWARAYGVMDTTTKRPVNIDTLFQAGSVSKCVAAVAAMRLVQEGRLHLDENVNAQLKSWHVPENEFTKQEKVTLRRILSHSAGLTVHGFPGYGAGASVPSIVQVLDGVKPANTAAIRVDFVPGTRFRYSGGGYTIMQLLMTDVTGIPFPQLMQETVLGKVGMDHSTYEQPLPERYRPYAATGYRANGDAIPGRYHTYPEMAAAGLWTTPSDLARLGIEIQKSREGRSNRVLTQATVNTMLTREKDDDGLGFFLEGAGSAARFGHNGANEGFQAFFLCTMTGGKGVAIMANSDNGIRLAQEIAYSVAAEYGWPDYHPEERTPIHLDTAALESFAGQYRSGDGTVLKIVRAQDHLLLTVMDNEFELYPASRNSFFALEKGVPDIRFTKDAAGTSELSIGDEIRATKTQ